MMSRAELTLDITFLLGLGGGGFCSHIEVLIIICTYIIQRKPGTMTLDLHAAVVNQI